MMHKFKEKLFIIIFEANTPAGKAFDVCLLIFIFLSIILVMLESVQSIRVLYGEQIRFLETIITGIFSLEYALRVYVSHRPFRYMRSFFGLVDLLSILPFYIGLFFMGSHNLIVIRVLRLLRIFRIFKFTRYTRESNHLLQALLNSRAKLTVFVMAVSTLVTIFGSLMYLIEGDENGFTSIPQSIYWAIVTLTTVGYGDIAPQTNFGRFISSLVMIVGYAIIAIPTGIVGYEITQVSKNAMNTRVCPNCMAEGHDFNANFCKACGAKLPANQL